jgi:hypothetical protein
MLRPSKHCGDFLFLSGTALSIAILCFWAFFGIGCSKQRPLEDQTPAGSSSLSVEQAKRIVAFASLSVPNGAFCEVAPTGSMAPVIDSRSVLLLERYIGQRLNVGDIVIFDRGDIHSVCHRVVEIKQDAFYVSGDNNRNSDGWHKLSSIKHRVVGVIYTQR